MKRKITLIVLTVVNGNIDCHAVIRNFQNGSPSNFKNDHKQDNFIVKVHFFAHSDKAYRSVNLLLCGYKKVPKSENHNKFIY